MKHPWTSIGQLANCGQCRPKDYVLTCSFIIATYQLLQSGNVTNAIRWACHKCNHFGSTRHWRGPSHKVVIHQNMNQQGQNFAAHNNQLVISNMNAYYWHLSIIGIQLWVSEVPQIRKLRQYFFYQHFILKIVLAPCLFPENDCHGSVYF